MPKLKDRWGALKGSIKQRLHKGDRPVDKTAKKLRKKKKARAESPKSEIEQLIDQLICDTVGTNGQLQQHLNRLLKRYNADNNPLGVDEAKTILLSLIRLATGQRRLLAGRIEKSVEEGGLFDQYYGKMQTINLLTIRTNAKMKKMQVARELFEYQKAVYHRVTGKTYKEDVIPNDGELPTQAPKVDQWKEIDEEGGQVDEGETS